MAGIQFDNVRAAGLDSRIEKINFDFNTVFPLTLKVLVSGDTIEAVGVRIVDAFAFSSISIGFPADVEEIAPVGDINPTQKDIYEFSKYRESSITETLKLYASGAAGTGKGIVIIKFAK